MVPPLPLSCLVVAGADALTYRPAAVDTSARISIQWPRRLRCPLLLLASWMTHYLGFGHILCAPISGGCGWTTVL